MIRNELATKIQNFINKAHLLGIPQIYYEGLFDEVEKLRQTIGLAEFLGWEEGFEYEIDESKGFIYRVKENRLEYKRKDNDMWATAVVNLTPKQFRMWRHARKIEPKKVEKKPKAWHVKDKYSYNCLMKELEEQGYTWFSNIKPTKSVNWDMYKSNTVIFCHEGRTITYGELSYYETYEKSRYDLIEYNKEEPKFYAKIKGGKFLEPNHQYFRWHKKLKKITIGNNIRCAGNKDILDHYMTKSQWEELGINDTNADFEEV